MRIFGYRIKPVRERNPYLVALVGLLVLGLLTLIPFRLDDMPIIGGGTTYTGRFKEAAGVQAGDEVRIAGVKVGKVTDVQLRGTYVSVSFLVKDAWVGDSSTVSIMIKTLLGAKYVAIDPLGAGPQDPDEPIPMRRTTVPYDVTEAFNDLSYTYEDLDTKKFAKSLDTMAQTFSGTPPHVKKALSGLSALSKVIASRDVQLKKLLAGTKKVSGTLADQSKTFETLIGDSNKLLAELKKRRKAIHALLTGSQKLGRQLRGLVKDNNKQLEPALKHVEAVADVLLKNQKSLDKALKLAGPYFRLLGNTTGNGRWVDGYICGLTPPEYLENGALPPTTEHCIPTRKGGK